MEEYVKVTQSTKGDAQIPNHKHYVILGVDEFMQLSKEACIGRQDKKSPELQITDGDELVNAFIRGFNFHAAGEPKQEGVKSTCTLTGEDVYDAGWRSIGKLPPFSWANTNDSTREHYCKHADELNKLLK